MKLNTAIEDLIEAHLADPRKLDVVSFVDQVLALASDHGAVGGTWNGGQRVQFTVRDPADAVIGAGENHSEGDGVYNLESPFARSVLRMLCARLGVLCQERTGREISLYGDQAVIEHEDVPRRRWKISFTNTPERQEFLIERV